MLRDTLNRPVKDLRISVTDRCNYRCSYCMPNEKYEWVQPGEILSFEEIARLAGLFVRLGTEKVRLTGGEPLLRRNLEKLVALLAPMGLADLCLTTNGSLLAEKAEPLAAAGLKRVNVSLDTLDREKFRRITRRDNLEKVVQGLLAAEECGLTPIKINTVIERGFNDDEIIGLVQFAQAHDFHLRFIEYMDVGNVNGWNSKKTVPKQEILERISSYRSLQEIGREEGSAPSRVYRFVDGSGNIGVIASVTEPFCRGCTRARLTADGRLVTCLFSEHGEDLKTPLRRGAADEEISAIIRSTWSARGDRYSEERFAALNSAAGYKPGGKKIEMISLGG